MSNSEKKISTVSFLNLLPPWSISLIIHLLILVVLAFVLRTTVIQVRGVNSDRTAEVGIELKSRVDGKTYYQSSTEFSEDSASSQAGKSGSTTQAVSLQDISSPITLDADPSRVLPGALGISAAEVAGTPGGLNGFNGSQAGNGNGVGEALDGAGKGVARCFGTSGTGRRFVYVFDRSGSMGGGSRSALVRAKAELVRSFRSLTPLQQFLIVFYNEAPVVFPAKDLSIADERGKQNAENFVNSIGADGGTDHLAALKKAIACKPDVIFFLTDADEPRMSTGQLATIKRLAREAGGIQINTIEFGLGPKISDAVNFIQKLALDNSGQYIYVDISTF